MIDPRRDLDRVVTRFEHDVERGTYTVLRWREFGRRPFASLAARF